MKKYMESFLQIRVDKELKDSASQIFESIGLDLSSAIRMFLKQTVNKKTLPFDLNSKDITKEEIVRLLEEYTHTSKEPIYSFDELITILKNEFPKLSSFKKIQQAYLFGSYARGEANTNSDIDIRVKLTKEGNIFDLSHIQYELEKVLKKKVDIICPNDNDEFLKLIRKEEIMIYEKSEP